ncbi:MAG: RDD family protein [Firmicutes bacterium]|nr:RDD family protein [Clostridiales bacterium]MBQ2846322.1 RDD family protein [Bacillota bacterium]MBQ4339445.1 RDD family protein [Bacillota bacterium]
MSMFIKDGQLPEDILARKKAGTYVEETSPEAPAEEPVYVKPFSEFEEEDWYELYPKTDIMVRLKVHLLDTAVFYAIFAAIYFVLIPNTVFSVGTLIFWYLFAVYTNAAIFVTWPILFITNGFTPAKYFYKQRVVRMDGERLGLKDVIVRSLLIKGFCNAASCGIFNIVSIIFAYARPYHKALHDVAASTITLDIREKEEDKEKPVEFK